MRYLALAFLTLPLSAHAGSNSRDCATPDRSIVMGAGNSTNRVQIKFIDSDGKAGTYDVPVKIMPDFDYNTEENEQTLTAVPFTAEKIVTRKHQVMHVVHKDGSVCDGRERWDDQSVQSYVLMGKDGLALYSEFNGEKVKDLTPDGYLVASFQCHSYGETTPGGCFADAGDKITWVDEK
jgi:hypothetical protein